MSAPLRTLSAVIACVLCFALVTDAFSQHASAQTPTGVPLPAYKSKDHTLAKLLERGKELENKTRWTDAFVHYENAVRAFPKDDTLRQRLTLARIHCDLTRRYSDPSYKQLTLEISESHAMDVYSDVLRKIRLHYVDQPNWQMVVWRGTANLDVAVGKSIYQNAQIPTASPPAVDQFRRELRSSINTLPVRNQADCLDVVSRCARLAAERLQISTQAVILEYVCGAVSSLDPYSSYLTGAQLDDVYSQIAGNFVGLGIELKADENALLIVKTIPGGPAQKAGIVAGDRITHIDGKVVETHSADEAAEMLRGARGSHVTLGIRRPNVELSQLRVRREEIDVPSVEDTRMIDEHHGIAYFRLACFQKTTSREVDQVLWKLHREGMKALVIDVRGNPGGLLNSSVEVVDKFLQHGLIVSTRGRSSRENFDFRAHSAGSWRLPLVVLIDGDTASAGEIFAGAIRDHRRGTIVGRRSFGKGSVQGIFPLDTINGGLRITTAKFYSPSGKAISDDGVRPHINIPALTAVAKPVVDGSRLASEHDPALDAALDVARSQSLVSRTAG